MVHECIMSHAGRICKQNHDTQTNRLYVLRNIDKYYH